VIAVTSRPQHTAYLSGLGAHEVSTPEALNLGTRPLEQARFGGAVDNVGGALLSGLLRHVRPWGNVAAVGNAGGPGIDTTVFPFILRGVSLIGGSSSNCPMPQRHELWQRLALEVRVDVLARLVDRVVPLAGVWEAAALVLDRQVRGRILVDCR
jgi:acrylyl-CoA reductase (NADPH)